MSKKKITGIVYLIFAIICIAAIAYQIWKEKIDIEYKTKIINSEVLNVQSNYTNEITEP